MTTRSTARRVLRSDTAPERRLLELEDGHREDSAPGATNRSRTGSNQRLDQLETGLTDLRLEFAAAHDSLRVEVTAELTNINSSISAEMTEIKGHLSNLVQALHNMSTTLNQTQAAAATAQQVAVEARAQTQAHQQSISATAPIPTQLQAPAQVQYDVTLPTADVPMMTPVDAERVYTSTNAMDVPRLRKMDVSPPTFEGAIDGIKLNSFLFQFESYFHQKGYSLAQHDHILPRELNQCVRKNALIWYERYMTDDMTTKLWGVMKSEMIREFREPNFQAKVRNQLLKIKQIGAYDGYVNKFRELQRVVGLDELTAINVFVNGLTNNQMKVAIQRKQPTTLTAAVHEGFLEWELQDEPAANNQYSNDHGGSGKKAKRWKAETQQ
ncbi:hypothetical protein PF003_g5007 [Phytophthora fragariae]|nr:hypothetical protein PF003_g5007 [Phytophthora fragariae]